MGSILLCAGVLLSSRRIPAPCDLSLYITSIPVTPKNIFDVIERVFCNDFNVATNSRQRRPPARKKSGSANAEPDEQIGKDVFIAPC